MNKKASKNNLLNQNLKTEMDNKHVGNNSPTFNKKLEKNKSVDKFSNNKGNGKK